MAYVIHEKIIGLWYVVRGGNVEFMTEDHHAALTIPYMLNEV